MTASGIAGRIGTIQSEPFACYHSFESDMLCFHRFGHGQQLGFCSWPMMALVSFMKAALAKPKAAVLRRERAAKR